MPRKRDPRRDEAFALWENGLMPFSDIADSLGVSVSQIRKWKSEDSWDGDGKSNVNRKSNVKSNTKSNVTKRLVGSGGKSNDKIISEFEKLVFKDLTDEERQILGSNRDKYKEIQAQIDRYTIQELRILDQIKELEVMPTGAKNRGEDVNMVADTVKVSKGTHIGQNENLIEFTSVAKEKRLMELWNQLARVQSLKTQALKAKHQMMIDDARYGLTMNEGVEMAKDNARMVLEALTGKTVERGNVE